MSRVGKKPIPLPKGVKITIGNELLVEGPKGKQTVPVPAGHHAAPEGWRRWKSSATATIKPRCTG